MGRLPAYSALVPLLLCAILSCSRGPRLIPPSDMSDIYADMLLSDQWLRVNFKAKGVADTTYFYDPIFESYGYTFEDFDYSVNYYIDKPDVYSKLLSKSALKLVGMQKEYENLAETIRKVNEYNKSFLNYKSKAFHEINLWPSKGPAGYGIVKLEDISDNVERRDSIRTDKEQEAGEFAGDKPLAQGR